MKSEQIQLNNKTGLYLRLSKDDERIGESLSIDNQRLILQKYAKDNGFTVIDEYVDDGYSGTTFDRPEVQRLLDDAKTGKINTIIVKDLSRFGRNYIFVGQYLDYIFPAYGIRFIAISDNVDTADKNSTEMDMMPIMNVFNEWHSANTSKKIRAVLEASQRAGKYTSGWYPYGYVVGNDAKRSAIIDEPAAKVVRRIFDMRLQGYTPYRIARILSDEHIPNPTDYRTKNDGGKVDRPNPHWWSHKTVRVILEDRTYTGCTIQHRRTSVSYKNHKQILRPQSEWIISENSHEPIVDEETFRKAQEITESAARSKLTKTGETTPLTGLLFCEDCGAKMKYGVNNKKYKDTVISFKWYLCRTYANLGKSYCTTHGIKREDIEAVVLADIRSQFKLIEFDEAAARKEFLRNKAKYSDKTKAIDEKRLKELQKRSSELDLLIQSAFEEKVLNHLPEAVCADLCEKYQNEKETVNAQIVDLEKKIAEEGKDENDVDEYIRRIKKYGACEELTREMCLQLIEYITIDEKKMRNSRWGSPAPRNIHIYYKFIDNSDLESLKAKYYN